MFSLATHAEAESRALALPPEDGELAEMLARWHAQRGKDALPPRACVTFEAMLPMVGRINLVEVGPPRAPGEMCHFAIRLVCTAREMRGHPDSRTIRDIRPAALARAVEQGYVECVRAAAPALHEVTLHDGYRTARFRRLLLPYAEAPGGMAPALLVACLVDEPGVREMMASPRFRDHPG
ncbi:MAG: hypothetical protein ACKO1J_15115 [Tagaea sp.]